MLQIDHLGYPLLNLFKERTKNMKLDISAFSQTAPGKVFLIAAIVSAAGLIILLLTGVLSFEDLIEISRKMIELCPFCMKA